MSLRKWQTDCIRQALVAYHSGKRHFLCLATPASGKTRMASTLASQLIQKNRIDLVLCFAPSVIVATDFQAALEEQLDGPIDGRLGSKGQSLTYQSMLNQDDGFWTLFDRYRILAIFDEIHHCAGDSLENANAWGEQIIRRIQGRATYTLALTGTPWRSDRVPISLASYTRDDKIHCDYRYGLQDAVQDKVCRVPIITLIDNDRIYVSQQQDKQTFTCFADLLTESGCIYQDLINNEALIVYMLSQASQKLHALRQLHANAGGLIVAASVKHAYKIADILAGHLGETATVVTYQETDPQLAISNFRVSTEPWIISVGMVSEGTNIPRLRVCCHLTRVKTELHFRQVLGRILRMDGIHPGDGYLYVPAEPSLALFAERVIDEVPGSGTLCRVPIPKALTPDIRQLVANSEAPSMNDGTLQMSFDEQVSPLQTVQINQPARQESPLATCYEANINLFGRFRQQLLTLDQLSA